jgi:hypothetical protein
MSTSPGGTKVELQRRDLLALSATGMAGLAATRIGLPSAAFAEPAGDTATETFMLSGVDKDRTVDWDFLVTDGRNSNVWSTVPVPSHWEFHGFGSYTHGFTLAPNEHGLYRHTFTAPGSWVGRRTYLVFEGAMTDTSVQLNGQSAGPTHQGGFYRFRYDVTNLLRCGEENLLEATVLRDSTDDSVNRAEREGDYWNFGGIYRPVYLQSYPAEHIDRLAIDAKADGSFALDVYLAGVTTADRVTAQVTTLGGEPVGPAVSVPVGADTSPARLRTTIARVQTWSAETPQLYRVDVRLQHGGRLLHRTSERFGFRTMEVRLGDGVYVNGQKIRFKGACRHTFWPDSGRAMSVEVTRQDIVLMKQMNMNAVRSSHYPSDTYFLDLCDELGLYVIDELAGWQKPYSAAIAAPLVKSMVTRDVNHPCVLFWANGNEGGFQFAVDGDYALYDPQNRPVIHPNNGRVDFSGINTDHYESYDATRADLAVGTIFMTTEMLHGLYDGGAGAALSDYWDLMSIAPRGAGGYIWALLDEGIRRDDLGGVIDVNPNFYPDGILGPYRQKEASFFTIRDVWSPIQLADRRAFEQSFPDAFTGVVNIANHYDFINTRQCRFSWQLIDFADPAAARAGHTIRARAAIDSPDIAPGGTGVLRLKLPNSWRRNDALVLIARDPYGNQVNAWTWTIAKAADHAARIVNPVRSTGTVTATEDATGITLSAAHLQVTIDPATGRLSRVAVDGSPVSLTNGPALATGTATLTGITSTPNGTARAVTATYSGDLDTVTWTLYPSGWLRLDYLYHLTGSHDFLGVNFDYPVSQVTGMTWLGNGPYRVYKNRTRGFPTDVWTKEYNDTATGIDWQYPEFKGYHAKTYWATLRTAEGPITIVAADEDLFLRLFTPRWGPGAGTAVVPFPGGDISLLDGIPAMGTKFDQATSLGPESQPNLATGDYRRTIYFRFGGSA